METETEQRLLNKETQPQITQQQTQTTNDTIPTTIKKAAATIDVNGKCKIDINNQQQQANGNVYVIQNKKFIEIAASVSSSLAKFSTGLLIGWSSPSIPKLLAPDSPIQIDENEGSWIASSMQAGSFFAVFIMVATVDVIGRKAGILLSTLPILISWLMMTQASTFGSFYVARFISGLGSGYGKIVVGTYIGEISQPSIRGALGTFMGITYILGVLFSFTIGPLVTINQFAYISMSFPILLLVTFIWMPETPYFYLMHGKEDIARKQLERLRGHTMIDDELKRMATGVGKRVKLSKSFKRLFADLKNREPLIIICILFLSIQFTGKVPIISYCETIFRESGGAVSPYWATIITGITQLVALIVSVFIIDRCGRRLLLIISCSGCAISLGSIAIYFFVKEQLHLDTTSFSWLPLMALIVYNFVFNIGLGNVPFIMVGELFSTDVKSVAVCLTSLCLPFSSVINIKLYQWLVVTYGAYTSFALFSIVSVLSTIYCYFRVPETKGKNLEEIQIFFEQRR